MENEVSKSSSKNLKTNLASSQMHAVLHCCLKNLQDDKPKHGTFKAAWKKFKCCRRTVAVTWKRCEDGMSTDPQGGNITAKTEGKSGHKAGHLVEELSKLIRAVPSKARTDKHSRILPKA